MRTANRGDVPAPHVAPKEGTADPVQDLVFDAGSLSFVQDWVEGADGGEAATEIEPDHKDPRQSNPNRRLGVGAQSKKTKQDRPEPNALEKKLLRKRQRQELSDAIAGEMDTHGVAEDDKDGEGESKTASFKGKIRGRGQPATPNSTAAVEVKKDAATAATTGATNGTTTEERGPASGAEDDVAEGEAAGQVEGQGDKQGRKRKARRKKSKPDSAEMIAGEEVVVEESRPSASSAVAEAGDLLQVSTGTAMGAKDEDAGESEPGTKKQRRGWGKPRSKLAARADSELAEAAKGPVGSGADERRPRKKTRSRQKNIRKDKRPVEERPAHLRAGDPEFSGRGLTNETRKYLGLQPEDVDQTPPAGWGKPGKEERKSSWVNPGWVIDKQPRRIPKHMMADGDEIGVDRLASDEGRNTGRKAPPVVGSPSSGKSKYKNLALPPSAKKAAKKKTKSKRRGSSSSDVARRDSGERGGKDSST